MIPHVRNLASNLWCRVKRLVPLRLYTFNRTRTEINAIRRPSKYDQEQPQFIYETGTNALYRCDPSVSPYRPGSDSRSRPWRFLSFATAMVMLVQRVGQACPKLVDLFRAASGEVCHRVHHDIVKPQFEG